MSEAIAIGVLLVLTVTVTALVGLSVLVFTGEDDAGPQAEFTFDYVSESSSLIITHAGGDEFQAGNLVIAGPDSTVTWADVSRNSETDLVGPGSLVQLNRNNAYGDTVITGDRITVSLDRGGNVTEFAVWDES